MRSKRCFSEGDYLDDAFAISNPVVNPLRDVLGFEKFGDLENAVNLAVSQAAHDAFLLGVKFMQDPTRFILEEGEEE